MLAALLCNLDGTTPVTPVIPVASGNAGGPRHDDLWEPRRKHEVQVDDLEDIVLATIALSEVSDP